MWILASPALLRVERGTAFVTIVNMGSSDLLLYLRTVVETLSEVRVVSLPPGVEEVPSYAAQVMAPTLPDQIDEIHLYILSTEEQKEARCLWKHASVFSSNDSDLDCTSLISHEIPLLNDIPIQQRYCCIPLSD